MTGIMLLDESQQRALTTDSNTPLRQQPLVSLGSGLRVDQRTFHRTGRSSLSSQAQPRIDFTLSSRGDRKPSADTCNSSATSLNHSGDFASSVHDVDHGDSFYPMLRDDRPRGSMSSSDSSSKTAVQYAGTSSGLKISVRFILLGLMIGLGLGLALSHLGAPAHVGRWISLPGDLFLRALKCVVVPYVFCSVAVAIGDIVFVGKVSVVGTQTAKIFAIFWLASVTLGVAVALAFSPLFRIDHPNLSNRARSAFGFKCANGEMLSVQTNGTLACSVNATANLATESAFTVTDMNHIFSRRASSSAITQLSLSELLMHMITSVISMNVLESMIKSELLSIITFSMVLGTIAGRNFFTKSRQVNYLYLTLLQLRNTFFLMMEWTIWLSPIAVISIVAGSFASNQSSLQHFMDAGAYILAAFTAGSIQMLVLYPLIVFLLTRVNPYAHMASMVRAYAFAFACSSSLATAPVTLTCVRRAKVCSQSLANFVVSIGVCSSVSGMGFYTPIALVFMAESSGNGDQLTMIRLVGIFTLSLLSCAGTPPIPASGLVVISTAYTTLFGELPSTFTYVVALDFIFDRITTTCNVNDDLMALKIIAEITDETVAQDQLGERI